MGGYDINIAENGCDVKNARIGSDSVAHRRSEKAQRRKSSQPGRAVKPGGAPWGRTRPPSKKRGGWREADGRFGLRPKYYMINGSFLEEKPNLGKGFGGLFEMKAN